MRQGDNVGTICDPATHATLSGSHIFRPERGNGKYNGDWGDPACGLTP